MDQPVGGDPQGSESPATESLYGGELLADLAEDSTVYLVETPSEVAALQRSDLPAVCVSIRQPGGAWLPSYTDQLRPFNVVVIPSFGYPSSNPVLARARAKALTGNVRSVKLTPPPPPGPEGGGMDVGSYLLHHTVDELVTWAREVAPAAAPHRNGHTEGGTGPNTRLILPHPSDPMAVARRVLPKIWGAGTPRLIRWRGAFYRWTGSYWEEQPDTAVRAGLYHLLEDAVYFAGKDADTGENVYSPWRPSKPRVSNVVEALEAVTYLEDQVEEQSWVSYDREWTLGTHIASRSTGESRLGTHGDALPTIVGTTLDILPVQDGLLHLRTRTLHPPTPHFFSLSALPFQVRDLLRVQIQVDASPRVPMGATDLNTPPDDGVDRDAICVPTPYWESFLHSLWPDDPDSVELLQEWFGYVLSGDIRQHKILILVGPPRSGKGTIARVLAALVGARHVAGPTMGELAQNFGLASLIGKKLAVVADARFTGRDLMVAVERLLTISGADWIDVPRKFKLDWHGQLGVRFTFLSNELPRLPDVSGAIATRFLVLQLMESWLGREDLELEARLMSELPGILLWGLDGLDRLRARGHFQEPKSTRDAVRALMESTSAIKAFLADRCEVGPYYEAPTAEVFSAWKEWCETNGVDHPGTAQRLGHDLRAAIPRLRTGKKGASRSRQVRVFLGLRLLGATEVQQDFEEYGEDPGYGEPPENY